MFSCKVNNVDIIDSIDSIDVVLEDAGGNSIISSNRANINIDRARGKAVDFFPGNEAEVIIQQSELETNTLFVGSYIEEKKTEENTRSKRDITVFDLLKEIANTKFEADEVYLDKSYSFLMNTLLEKLGISTLGISISSDFIINYAYFKEGDRIIDEVKELLAAVNGRLYANKWNVMRFNNGIDNLITEDSNITFDETYMQKSIEIYTQKAEFDKIRIEYSSYQKLENQTVFSLQNDKRIAANGTGTLLCNYVSSACLNVELKKILIEDASKNALVKKGVFLEAGEEVVYNYTDSTVLDVINISQNQVELKLTNTNSFEVFLTELEFSGEPIMKYDGNSLEYAADETSSKVDTQTSKYIQNSEAALALAKACYREKCNDIETYNFSSKVVSTIDVLYKAKLKHDKLNISETDIILRKINYKISRKSIAEMTIEAEKYSDYTYPASPYINIIEKVGTNSLDANNASESAEQLTTQVSSLITEIVDDISDTENVYAINVSNYIHTAKPLIRFFAKKANTSACTLKVNENYEYSLKKLGWTKDLEADDIIQDMIVLCNFNSRKNVYEILNTAGIVSMIREYSYTFADILAVAKFTKVEQKLNTLDIQLRWNDPTEVPGLEEIMLRMKIDEAWQTSDTIETGYELLYDVIEEDGANNYSYKDFNLTSPASDVTCYFKLFYKKNGEWQETGTRTNTAELYIESIVSEAYFAQIIIDANYAAGWAYIEYFCQLGDEMRILNSEGTEVFYAVATAENSNSSDFEARFSSSQFIIGNKYTFKIYRDGVYSYTKTCVCEQNS